jgi:division protein CdvB (Snf7/Vps24/ESCRT-III family)
MKGMVERALKLPRRGDPMRKAVETLYLIRVTRDKLSRMASRIEERKAELTRRMVDLEAKGEKYLAKKYAEEIARLHELLKRLSALQLVIEKMDLAVQHAIVMRDLTTLSLELTALMKDVSKLPEARIPDLAVMFSELEATARELSEVAFSGATLSYSPPSSSEVSKILEEAREVLKKSLMPEDEKPGSKA